MKGKSKLIWYWIAVHCVHSAEVLYFPMNCIRMDNNIAFSSPLSVKTILTFGSLPSLYFHSPYPPLSILIHSFISFSFHTKKFLKELLKRLLSKIEIWKRLSFMNECTLIWRKRLHLIRKSKSIFLKQSHVILAVWFFCVSRLAYVDFLWKKILAHLENF